MSLSAELFLPRPNGVLLHGFMDAGGELAFSLQAPATGDASAIGDYGLVIVNSAPSDCVLDTERYPPALHVGNASFVLHESQVAQVRAFLHLHCMEVPHGRLS